MHGLPLATPSTYNLTEEPPTAVPVKVRVVALVVLSVSDVPKSDPDERSGVEGAVSSWRITITPDPPFPPAVLWLTVFCAGTPPSQAAPPTPPPPVFAVPFEPIGEPFSVEDVTV